MTRANIECVHAASAQLGETPIWDVARGLLWWIDIERPTLWQLDPSMGKTTGVEQPGTYLGCLALARSGRQLIARDLDLLLRDPETCAETLLAATPGETMPATRLNDGRVDAHGRLWIGSMDNGLSTGLGSLYRVDPNGTMTPMFGDTIVSNGIAFDPDGRHMYFTDTRRYTTWRLTLDEAGEQVTERTVFADYSATGERPDGACIDVDGCLWQAFFGSGKVVRYTPEGRIDREIALPVTNPTCLCFGGADLRTLFITTATKFLTPDQLAQEPLAGAVLAIEGVGQGIAEHLFDA